MRVTSLTITEKLYDVDLNPTHAEAQLELRVLTPTSSSSPQGVSSDIATAAYDYSHARFPAERAVAAASTCGAPAAGSSVCSRMRQIPWDDMFFPGSRYATPGTYTARTASGATVIATRLPIRSRPAVRGFHPRIDTQRLDLLAAHYLGDATAFWRLCDASQAIAPDALAMRDRIAHPRGRNAERWPTPSRCCSATSPRPRTTDFYKPPQLARGRGERRPARRDPAHPADRQRGQPARRISRGVGDHRFKPYARIAVVATPDGGPDACIFDGYVLSHKIHLDRRTPPPRRCRCGGRTRSCLMNLEEIVKEWSGKTDGEIANAIFGDYSLDTARENTGDDSGQHTEAGHTVMQRGDGRSVPARSGTAQRQAVSSVLRRAARPEHRVLHQALIWTGAQPRRSPSTRRSAANVDALDFEWDVARPTQVLAQALFTDKDPENGDTSESGLKLLDAQSLAAFTGGDQLLMEARLTAPPTARRPETADRVRCSREAGWFVRCEGEADLARLRCVLRVATVVQIDGAGKLHSGKYFVWSVRHTITAESHRMKFVLVRNAVGSL